MPVLIFVWPKFTDTAFQCAFLYWLHKPFVNQYFQKSRFYKTFNCLMLFLMPILALPLGSYVNSFLSHPNVNHLQEY